MNNAKRILLSLSILLVSGAALAQGEDQSADANKLAQELTA